MAKFILPNSMRVGSTSNTGTLKVGSGVNVAADGTISVTATSLGATPLVSSNNTTAATAGWYRIATSAVNIGENAGHFEVDFTGTGVKGRVVFYAAVADGVAASVDLEQVSYSSSSATLGLSQARIVYNTTNTGNYAYVEVYNPTALALTINASVINGAGWTTVDPSTAGSVPGGYSSNSITFAQGQVSNGQMIALGNITGNQLISTAVTGTAPFSVSSTTKVANLNADLVDGYNTSTTASANTIPVYNASAQLVGSITGNAATATTLQTGRTFTLTGDTTAPATTFDGSANISLTTTLANSGVTAGSYPKVTVNAKGLVTSGGNLASADVTTGLGFTPANKAGDSFTGAVTFSGGLTVPSGQTTTINGSLIGVYASNGAVTGASADLNGNAFAVGIAAPASTAINPFGITTGGGASAVKAFYVNANNTVGTLRNTLDNGSGNMSVAGTLSVTGTTSLGTATATTPTTADNSTNIATTAFVKAQSYLTSNQSISVTGDATGSGTTSISLTLANSGVTAGTYTKVTVDSKGRVTTGASMSSSDVTTSLGYTPVNKAGDTMTGALVLNADPVTALGAATKQYVDNTAQGLSVHKSVAVATTGPLAGAAYSGGVLTITAMTTLDGYTLVTNDRILVKDQATATQNGIYVYTNSTTLTRASDANTSSNWGYGTFVFVDTGTTNGASGWVFSGSGTFTLDTSNVTWTQFSGAGEITAGTGISKSGNTISLASGVATAGTYPKVTVDTYGRVTSGGNLSSSDVTTGLGFTPANKAGDTFSGKVTVSTGGLAITGGTTTDTLSVTSTSTFTGAVTLSGGGTSTTPTTADNSTAIATTAFVKAQSYLTGNQSISVTGDATGSGATSIALTLANSGVTAGTYTKVTVDSKGRVTTGATVASADISDATSASTANMLVKRDASGNFSAGTITAALSGNASTATKLATARSITLTGDATASATNFDGSANISIATTLANSGVTAGTYNSVTVNAKGLVTNASNQTTASSMGLTDVPIKSANTSDSLLTTTSATTVATFTPAAAGNFIVYLYFRIITADTALQIDVTYNDGTGAQTQNIVSSSPITAQGSYAIAPLYINATTASAITITATAGTANQVYVSGSILKL